MSLRLRFRHAEMPLILMMMLRCRAMSRADDYADARRFRLRLSFR